MKKLLWTIVLVMAVGGLWYSYQDKTPAAEAPAAEEAAEAPAAEVAADAE